MRLEHEFTVPVPREQAWQVLLDIERIAPCLPGATVDSVEGDSFAGRVKVKVGPMTLTYRGNATFLERDEAAGRVTIKADGRETRGSGTAAATVTAVLNDEGERTRVRVDTDLAVTGKPAQFGRGVMVEVSNKLLGTFADCLEQTLAAEPEAVRTAAPGEGAAGAPATVAGAAAGAGPAPGAQPAGVSAGPEPMAAATAQAPSTPSEAAADAPRTTAERPTPEAIDLLQTAGVPVLKRGAPAAAILALLVLLWWVLRRPRP
jgi:carbon monoxide dehydrogenase subunit G